MMNFLYKIDEDGFRRAFFQKPYQVVGSFLEHDIQGGGYRPIHLDICDKVESGELEQWSGIGNAHRVNIKGDSVTIENIFDSVDFPPCTISIDVFRKALEEWLVFVKERETTRTWLKSLTPE